MGISAGKIGVRELEPIFSGERGARSEVNESLPKLLASYLQYHRIEGSTEATIKHKNKELRPFIHQLENEGHSLSAGDVSPFDILGHLEVMKGRGCAPATIHTRRRALHAWFGWMVDWEVLPANPVTKVKAPRLPKVRKPFLSEEAFNKLLDLCPLTTLLGSRRASILWVFATTGMRRRELVMLTRQDLDWERGQIRVLHGKGQKERCVPFMLEAQRVLVRYLHLRTDSSPELWVSEKGVPLNYHSVGTDMRRLYLRAEVPVNDPCHIFRRTFAANAVRQGIPRQYTQAIAGWSTPQMLDRYTAAMEAEDGAIEAFRGFKPFGD